MIRALLLSNSTNHGQGLLEHAREELADFLGADRRRVMFFPFALYDQQSYVTRIREALRDVCEVQSATDATLRQVLDADAYFVGGGNSWRLLAHLHREGFVGLLRRQVRDGVPYVGSSAGTNMACPTLRTTNDMPIVAPLTWEALGIVDFQMNTHYIDVADTQTHMGETRQTRLEEFLEENDVPVLALREGCWLRIETSDKTLGGTRGAVLFRRGHAPQELVPGGQVDILQRLAAPRYDSRS